MSGTNSHLSLICLIIKGLNSPTERHKITDWIHKQETAFCCIQRMHINTTDRYYLREKGWKKVFQAYGPRKWAGVAILISNKIDFQANVINHDEYRHFHIHQGKNLGRESLNFEHLCLNCMSTQIHKRNFTKLKHTLNPHSNSGRFQHPTLTNGQVI